MSQKKLAKKLWKFARLLSDAAEMAEELEDYKRMVSQFQGTCQRLVKERDEAITESNATRLYADKMEVTLDVSKKAHRKLGEELVEARETIVQLNDCDKVSQSQLTTLLDEGYVFGFARPPNPRDDRGPYEATGVVTGGIRVHFRRPTIGAALSAMIDSLTAKEKA